MQSKKNNRRIYKKKLTKKYLNQLAEKVKNFFFTYGTMRVPSFTYMAMALGVSPDDELFEQGMKELDRQFHIVMGVDHKTLEWYVDYVPF